MQIGFRKVSILNFYKDFDGVIILSEIIIYKARSSEE